MIEDATGVLNAALYGTQGRSHRGAKACMASSISLSSTECSDLLTYILERIIWSFPHIVS
jgi:hypothetical protein